VKDIALGVPPLTDHDSRAMLDGSGAGRSPGGHGRRRRYS